MARTTTTQSRGQRGRRAQNGANYRCRWCNETSTHGQAIMSHIRRHLKDGHKQEVQNWLNQFPATPAGRDQRMAQLRIASTAPATPPRSAGRPRGRSTNRGTNEAISAQTSVVSAAPQSVGTNETNYYQLGYNEDAALLASYRQQISAAEDLTARLKPEVEKIERRIQAASALINESATTMHETFATVGSQEQTTGTPRALHA